MKIIKPTLLLNKARALRNIERMAAKARQNGVRFRPHFKTHQSAQIGDWFRYFGVEAITVSSLDMAWYFAQYGWKDILVAFPVNILEIDKINTLAGDITLHLLLESPEAVDFLEDHLLAGAHVKGWIKIDTGYRRSGLEWDDFDQIIALVKHISQAKKLSLQGLLTHAGQTYDARSKAQIRTCYTETITRLKVVQEQLAAEGFTALELSVGDTPSCSVVKDLSDVHEIRPGNFVFYDVMQLTIGACTVDDLAAAVACPIVAKHEARLELVMYGGAVHFSKETLSVPVGKGKTTPIYGYLAQPVLPHGEGLSAQGWDGLIANTYVSRLSQEHGIISTDAAFFQQVKVGDVVCVLPVHSCLTANLLRKYLTLEGEVIVLAALT